MATQHDAGRAASVVWFGLPSDAEPLRDGSGFDVWGLMKRSLSHPAAILLASLLPALVYMLRMTPRLPSVGQRTGDSAAYLSLASYRPPLYGWLLNGWQWLHGNLSGLPVVQLVMLMAALMAFAFQFGQLLRSAIASLVIVPAAMAHPSIHDAPAWMMTESLYIATIAAGLAAQFRYARCGGGGNLLVSSLCFALATITRSTGVAFMLLPFASALLDVRYGLASRVRTLAVSLGAFLIVLVGAMSFNLSRHGNFEVGSWSGMSLLTKSLLLIEPADIASLPAPLQAPVQATLPYAEASRALIAAQPDLAARLRAQVQSASTDLRWSVFVPAASQTWPQWRQADWRERGRLAASLSSILILRHPAGAALLWWNDWLALVIQPAYWPSGMTTVAADQNDFVACARVANCWALQRYDLPVASRLILLLVSLAGPVASAIVMLTAGARALRLRAGPVVTLFVLLSIVIQASLLLSSAFESGHVRYTVAIHMLELPLLLWLGWHLYERVVSRTGAEE